MTTIPDLRDPQERLRVRLERHPRLDEALHEYTGAILRLRARIGFASKLLAKEERYRAFMIFGMMSILREAQGERDGMPSGAFCSYCSHVAGLSKRTAQSTLQLLVLYRFAESRTDPGDRRSRLYGATDQLRLYLEDWVGASVEALRRLDVGGTIAREPPSRHLAVLSRSGGEAYARDGYMFFPDPGFRHVFAELENGSVVVMAALEAAAEGRVGPSRGELNTRFRISRAQATRIVAAGRACGLFGADGAGSIVVLPHLQELYRDCLLRVLSFLAVHYEAGSRVAERERLAETA